jgi:hypothetical protein
LLLQHHAITGCHFVSNTAMRCFSLAFSASNSSMRRNGLSGLRP